MWHLLQQHEEHLRFNTSDSAARAYSAAAASYRLQRHATCAFLLHNDNSDRAACILCSSSFILSERCGSLFFLYSLFLCVWRLVCIIPLPFACVPLFHHLASCLLPSVSLGVRILGSEQQLLWQLRCFILLFSLFNCNLGSDQVGKPNCASESRHGRRPAARAKAVV